MKELGENSIKKTNWGKSFKKWSTMANAERANSVSEVINGTNLISLIHLWNAYYMQDNVLSTMDTEK